MAVMGKRSVGIPIVLLHEGEGLILTVDTKSGITYRGYCVETEDNMNIKMTSVVATEADGSQRSIDHVFIRGSQVNFICFPDILAHAPMFDRVAQRKNGVIVERGLGRARQAALDAKAARRGGPSTGAGAAAAFTPMYNSGAPRPMMGQTGQGQPGPRPSGAMPTYGTGSAASSAPRPVMSAPNMSSMPPRGMMGLSQGAPPPAGGMGRGRGATVPHWAQKG